MSAPVHGPGALSHARPAQSTPKSTRASASNLFKNHVSAAVNNTAAANTAASTPASTSAAPSTPAPDWRQLFGGGILPGANPAPSGSASASGAPVSKQASANAADSQAATPASPIDTLTAALQRAGVNTASLTMVAHDDAVGYPGGAGWVNHLITVTAGGRSENIDIGLMNINPDVAAMDIKRMLS